ncbi:MAG TPA: hypothetical protein VHF05_02165 [Candidatus Paceibacterota bacterium]|jgi:hypothetical protein|nr:hypothetical protein [Candidatus Paceibacterota bacterium]
MLQRLSNPKNPFGFSGVFSISGIALTFRRDAYDALKQSEHHLNFPLEILLTISKTYSRLIDINLFVTTMVKTWEASVEEAKRENIDSQVVSDQRKKHTRTLFQSVRAIALEAQTDLCDLLAKL